MSHSAWIVAAVVLLALAGMLVFFGPSERPELWFTPDQLGEQLLREEKFAEAAKAFADPARQGVALFRAGDFKAAVAAFARDGSPEGAFNGGNALVMLGKYDDAIKRYDRALSLRPGWKDAQENRALAVVRRDRLKTEGGDETGGQTKPDEVVFGKNKQSQGEPVQVAGGQPLSDDELRALWLRRVQTKPADFLRAKFAFEAQQQAETK